MNTLKFIVSLLVSLLFGFSVLGADPVVRFPLVSDRLLTNISKFKDASATQTYPDHYMPNEGTWSNSGSAAQNNYDIFVVKTANKDGGRILKMLPIPTTYQGMHYNGLVFVDVLTGETFTPVLLDQDNRNGWNDYDMDSNRLLQNYFHYGSFEIDGENIYVVVGYRGTPRYPTVMLTWGSDSNIADPGTIIDSFEMVSVEQPATKTSVEIKLFENDTKGGFGAYLLATSPKEFGKVAVEVSTDLKNWTRVYPEVLAIWGQSTVYYVPENEIGFYRAVEL